MTGVALVNGRLIGWSDLWIDFHMLDRTLGRSFDWLAGLMFVCLLDLLACPLADRMFGRLIDWPFG